MDRYLIYEDDNTKVEIDYLIHKFFEMSKPIFIKLEDKDFNFVLAYALEILKEKGLYTVEKGSKLIGNIPVIKSGCGLNLQPPYDCFNEILHYLCLFPNLNDNRERIEADINDCFEEQGFYCYIFPHKVFDIKGLIIHKNEENDSVLMFFGFKENNQELDFLDFL